MTQKEEEDKIKGRNESLHVNEPCAYTVNLYGVDTNGSWAWCGAEGGH